MFSLNKYIFKQFIQTVLSKILLSYTSLTSYDEFSVFWLRFPLSLLILHLLDPDPHSEYGSGSRKPIECGSNADSDPKHILTYQNHQNKMNLQF
jgi:hypothetical protein